MIIKRAKLAKLPQKRIYIPVKTANDDWSYVGVDKNDFVQGMEDNNIPQVEIDDLRFNGSTIWVRTPKTDSL